MDDFFELFDDRFKNVKQINDVDYSCVTYLLNMSGSLLKLFFCSYVYVFDSYFHVFVFYSYTVIFSIKL